MARSSPRAFLRGIRGASAVEFAIAAPAFIMIIFGIFQFSMAIKARNELAHAAAQVARMVLIDDSVPDSTLENQIRTQLADLDSEEVDVDLSTETINGQAFRVIGITYPYAISMPFFSPVDVTLSVTRRAPQGL